VLHARLVPASADRSAQQSLVFLHEQCGEHRAPCLVIVSLPAASRSINPLTTVVVKVVGTAASYTFAMPSANVTLVAHFK
jgi:hypothetical protein